MVLRIINGRERVWKKFYFQKWTSSYESGFASFWVWARPPDYGSSSKQNRGWTEFDAEKDSI